VTICNLTCEKSAPAVSNSYIKGDLWRMVFSQTCTTWNNFWTNRPVEQNWGTGIRGLMRGMAILPRGNQELLVVRDKVGRPQVSLG